MAPLPTTGRNVPMSDLVLQLPFAGDLAEGSRARRAVISFNARYGPILHERQQAAASLLVPQGNSAASPDPFDWKSVHFPFCFVMDSLGRDFRKVSARAQTALAIANVYTPDSASTFLECGLAPRIVEVTLPDGSSKLEQRLNACRSRHCPYCRAKAMSTLRNTISAEIADYKWPTFLTLSVRHNEADPLEDLIELLYSSWTKLLRSQVMEGVRAGIKVVEIKRTANGWHPHLHIIMDSEWIPHKLLQAAWIKATGGSSQVNVTRIKSTAKATEYVAGYVAKAGVALDFRHEVQQMKALKGRKLIAGFRESRHVHFTANESATASEPEAERPNEKDLGSLASLLSQARSGIDSARIIITRLYGYDPFAPPPDRVTTEQQSLPLDDGSPPTDAYLLMP